MPTEITEFVHRDLGHAWEITLKGRFQVSLDANEISDGTTVLSCGDLTPFDGLPEFIEDPILTLPKVNSIGWLDG